MADEKRRRDPVSDPDLKAIREAFNYDTQAWADIRREGSKDMLCVAGDPWAALASTDRAQRIDSNRPMLALDELGQYVNQVINDVRQHKRAIKVTPQGNGANDQTANIRANLYRQIEYRSNAQMAYTTMFENAVQRSYGYFRIKPRYVSDRSDEQELIIDPIMNPDLVTVDADILQPDGSDMRHAFIHEQWKIADFKKRFGKKAAIVDFSTDLRNAAPKWIQDETLMLAEYWCLEAKTRKLLLVDGPQGTTGVFEDEIDDPKYAALRQAVRTQTPRTRDVETYSVRMQLTNGVEILEETDFKATTIPIVCCFGKVIYVDSGAGAKRQILSLIRLARDPYMLYCYYRTTEAELVGMTPKTPFVGYVGQFRGQETEWQKSAHEPVAFLQAAPTTEGTGTQVLPLPVRQPYDPPIQALEVGAEAARRAIQAAMGISPLPTAAQRRNEKSGKALQQMRDAEQQGSFHFVDHYEQAITRGGAILEDWCPHYYDSARNVTVREANDDTSVIRINDPNQSSWPKGQKEAVNIGGEQHDITLSVGPSTDSERETENDLADNLVQNIQMVAGIAGPEVAAKLLALSIKLKNTGPIATAMAELIAPKDQGAQQAAQLQKQVQQATQVINELSAHVKDLSQKLETKAVENQAKIEIARSSDATKIEIARIQAQADLAVAEIKAQVADMDRSIKALEAMVGVKMAEIDAERETRLAHHDAAHDAGKMAAEHGHEHRMAEAEHDRALELADKTHAQQLEVVASQPTDTTSA